MRISVTKKEFNAICNGLDMISTAFEGASEQFIKDYTPDCEGLNSLRKKCLASQQKTDLKRRIKKIIKDGQNGRN